MTAFGAIIDANSQTKTVFVRALERHFDEYYGGPANSTSIGDLGCHWRACASAPISTAHDGTTTAWVFGHIDEVRGPKPAYAEFVMSHFRAKRIAGLSCYGGFFLSIVCDRDDYYVFADRLGLFPCYYTVRGDRLLLGSSSDIPGFHPEVSRRLNRKGLIGHLLCMHEVLSETLWEGCRRLGAGEILHFSQRGVEVTWEPSIPISDESFGLSYEDQLENAHAAMLQAFEPYRGERVRMLCSGGLDSRLVAGYLGQLGARVEAAYTLGMPTDLEFRCARKVCRALGLPQQQIGVNLSRYRHYADQQIVTMQLANGFNDLAWWSLLEQVPDTGVPLVSGLCGDNILGGSYISWGYDASVQKHSFEKLFGNVNRYGLSCDLVCKLLPGDDTADLVAEMVERLRQCYERLPGYGFQKTWHFNLLHRVRFHLGGVLVCISHAVWPSTPLACSPVLAVAGGVPACAILGRRLQKDLLITRFPRLARLPLDRNSLNTRPLAPSITYRIKNKIARMSGMRKLRHDQREDRYYYRLYDINNEGWRLVRDACNRVAEALPAVVDPTVWRKILPDPSVPIKVQDPIKDVSGAKSLLGFTMWYERYAGDFR